MKNHLTILLLITTLIIGLVGGWFASAHFWNQWIGSYMKMNAYNSLAERCRVLSGLRANDTNQTAQTLETLMDGDILDFGSFLREIPAEKRKPEDIRLLIAVRDYRAAHPWKAAGHPDIDKSVAKVFALVSTNQTR
jgi:hypothetical protein